MGDPVETALESAESLITSLLTRDRTLQVDVDGGEAGPNTIGDSEVLKLQSAQDPEESLFSPSLAVNQSLVSEGSAPFFPNTLTATSQANIPEYFDLVSPKESLHALGMCEL